MNIVLPYAVRMVHVFRVEIEIVDKRQRPSGEIISHVIQIDIPAVAHRAHCSEECIKKPLALIRNGFFYLVHLPEVFHEFH